MSNPKTAMPVPLDGETLELLAAAEAAFKRQRQRRALWETPAKVDPVADVLAAMCKKCLGLNCDCSKGKTS